MKIDPRSHLTNTRSGVLVEISSELKMKPIVKAAGAADLLAGCVVAPRLQPAAGMRPASRLASGQNLSPRHLLLFMR